MRAILIRHYKTLINASDEIMGWGDAPRAKDWEPDLNYVSKILDDEDIQYTSVYTSDLERSRQTGRYFAKMRGISILHDHAELWLPVSKEQEMSKKQHSGIQDRCRLCL